MSARLGRCFVNSFPDFTPGQGEIATPTGARWMEAAKSSAADVNTHMPPLPEHCDGGLYVGNAGVAYMFYHLSKNTKLVAEKSHFLQKAQEYLKISLAYTDSRMSRDPLTSFILGKAGVYALASAISAETGDGKTSDAFADKFVKIAAQCKTKGNFLGCGSDELFVGRAGYLCGELFLRKTLGRQVSGDGDINGVCAAIVSSGRQYSQTHRSPCPLMYAYYGTEYLGAAHGLSSILQMLLCFPGYLKSDSSAEHDVRQCVEFMLSLEQPNGNYPPAMDDVKRPTAESEQLVHWCHGAPGIVYLFGRAYLHWKDSCYLDACVRCADLTWRCGLLRKGPGICHGVAGSGYVFLLLYRLTNEQKYLYRAEKFAEFLYTPEFKSGSRRPDTPFSLYEGWAGAACFLADLLEPNKAAFPLFDIF